MEHRRNSFCRFLARGYCKFGNRCRNSHIIPVDHRRSRYTPAEQSNSSGTSYFQEDSGPSTSSRTAEGASSSASTTPDRSLPGRNKGSPRRDRQQNTAANGEGASPQNRSSDNRRRTAEKHTCGICLEEIVNGKVFGILINCSHSFCMDCIRGWRMRKEYEARVKQACPECRTVSEFVIPSRHWVREDKKAEFIASYKERVGKIDCKYFKQGAGWCRFQDKCLYRHKLPDGSDPDYSKMVRPRCYHYWSPLVPDWDTDTDDSDGDEFHLPEYLQEFVSSPTYSSVSDDSDDLDDIDDLYSSDDSDDNEFDQHLYVLMHVIHMCSN